MRFLLPGVLGLALAASVAGAAAGGPADLVVLPAPAPAWRVTIAHAGQQAALLGPLAVLSEPGDPGATPSEVAVGATERGGRREALRIEWRGAWHDPLRIDGPRAIDLRPWLRGTLELDLDVTDLAQGGLVLAMGCGEGCERKLSLIEPARAVAGKGWQHFAFSLGCFVHDGDDFSAVRQPFMLELTGQGRVELARMRLVADGRSGSTCPDYRTQSVTPVPQVDTWTQDWWPQRHESRLAEIRRLEAAGTPPELVFIGDSITQRWEEAGREVWQQHYAKFHALNLGFSGDHTENVLWRLRHGEVDGIAPRVAVLMIGTNNTGDRQEAPETTAAGVRAILDELRTRLPATKVVLLAVFPRDERPDTPSRRLNDRLNTLIARQADGDQVRFLDIGTALADPDGTLSREVAPDTLHLSARGYSIWQREMDPLLQALMRHRER